MKNRKTTTSVRNVITAVSTRLRCGRFATAAGLMLLVTAGAAWGQPSEVAKLLASDGAADDRLGASVSISGDTAIVGAFTDNHSGFLDAGSAYIYQQDFGGPDIWGEVAILRADVPAEVDWFGRSVSISGDIAIVGAPLDDDACPPGNPACNSGSAFIFFRDQNGPDQWGQVVKLTADDAKRADQFGRSVSISADFAIVGSPYDDYSGTLNPGSAYIFYRNFPSNDQWGQVAKLTASDRAANDRFGFSVSISGDVAVLGAHYDDDKGLNSGSAYVFVKPPGGWVDMTQTAKLTAFDGAVNDQFGRSVAISGDVALVGALLDDDNGIESGSAYAFHEPLGGWVDLTENAKLTASDGAAGDWFGSSVSIRGEVAMVGASFHDDNAANSGSAYVFRFDGISWTETAELTASDGQAGDEFFSVSISGDLATIGAPGDDDNGQTSGSAYIFEGVCPCPWDIDGDGAVGVKDLLIFLSNWGPCPDPPAECPWDFDDDGSVGVMDLLTLLGRWGNCPCDEGPPPLSFEDELDEACVTQENWDDFVEVMQTGSEAEKENSLCWMNHHLNVCTSCICPHTPGMCPGPDPF